MRLLGLFGSMGSGKDSCGEFLAKERGYVARSLASPMKDFCQRVLGFSDEQVRGDSDKRNEVDKNWNVTPRRALQTLGTDWGRNMIHPDVWINYALDAINTIDRRLDVVITDVRFENELRRIQEYGGVVVKVMRPNLKRTEHMNHESEADQFRIPDSAFDAVIVNDGTLDMLRFKVLEFEKTVKEIAL